MDDVTIVRALHVVSVVLWIGGVAFVTTNSIAANGSPLESAAGANATVRPDRAALRLAGGVSTAIVGLTGFYMIYSLRYVGSLPACRLLVD